LHYSDIKIYGTDRVKITINIMYNLPCKDFEQIHYAYHVSCLHWRTGSIGNIGTLEAGRGAYA
jgi:hypothetical protein